MTVQEQAQRQQQEQRLSRLLELSHCLCLAGACIERSCGHPQGAAWTWRSPELLIGITLVHLRGFLLAGVVLFMHVAWQVAAACMLLGCSADGGRLQVHSKQFCPMLHWHTLPTVQPVIANVCQWL